MDSFRYMCEPRDMALTFLLLYATALYRVISEMQSLPGFGFTPTNDEIIGYVKRKRLDPDFSIHKIKEIDIYRFEPWDLLGEELVLYIFSEPDYKYNKSKRHHRRTSEGYWKVTGQGSKINAIGSKRILSFYYRGSKTDWVMHEFYVEYDPLYKKDFVLCRIERKREKTKHGIPPSDEGESNQQLVCYSSKPVTENTILKALQQSSNNLDSNRRFATENIFSVSELLPSDPVNSCSRNQGEENTFLDSINHLAENGFPESHLPPNHNMISDSGNHFAENASAVSQLPPNQNMISYSGNRVEENGSPELQHQPNHNMICYNGNCVAGNGSLESQQLQNHNRISCSQLPPNYNMNYYFVSHVVQEASAESQLPPNQDMISCSQVPPPPNQDMISHSGNHVQENGSPESQQLINHDMISNYGNRVAGNGSSESQLLPNHVTFSLYGNRGAKDCSPQSLLNHEMVSHYGSHIAENASFETRQQPNHNFISYPRNQIAENSFEYPQPLPNQRLDFYSMNKVTENTSDAKLLQLAESKAPSGYSRVTNASFSALQSPIYSGQGPSRTNCANNGGDLLNYQFGTERVNFLINSQGAFQNEFSSEQTGQTLIPNFNFSVRDAGVEDSRDVDAWLNELSEFLLD